MNVLPPCKGCKNHDIYCHVNCKGYLDYREKLKKIKEEAEKERQEKQFFYDVKTPIVKRYNRRRKGDDR